MNGEYMDKTYTKNEKFGHVIASKKCSSDDAVGLSA